MFQNTCFQSFYHQVEYHSLTVQRPSSCFPRHRAVNPNDWTALGQCHHLVANAENQTSVILFPPPFIPLLGVHKLLPLLCGTDSSNWMSGGGGIFSFMLLCSPLFSLATQRVFHVMGNKLMTNVSNWFYSKVPVNLYSPWKLLNVFCRISVF